MARDTPLAARRARLEPFRFRPEQERPGQISDMPRFANTQMIPSGANSHQEVHLGSPLPSGTLPNGTPVSKIGFGCSSLWARRTMPDAEAMSIIETAFAGGINHFDTSPSYGEGERRLGGLIGALERKDLVISTKVGTGRDGKSRSF